MSVGEDSVVLEPKATPRGRADRNGGRKRAKALDAPENGKPARKSTQRDPALRRLLAGLRKVSAGDFSVQLTPNGDPLMADIIDAFNGVTQKQARLVGEISRVSRSVGGMGQHARPRRVDQRERRLGEGGRLREYSH